MKSLIFFSRILFINPREESFWQYESQNYKDFMLEDRELENFLNQTIYNCICENYNGNKPEFFPLSTSLIRIKIVNIKIKDYCFMLKF